MFCSFLDCCSLSLSFFTTVSPTTAHPEHTLSLARFAFVQLWLVGSLCSRSSRFPSFLVHDPLRAPLDRCFTFHFLHWLECKQFPCSASRTLKEEGFWKMEHANRDDRAQRKGVRIELTLPCLLPPLLHPPQPTSSPFSSFSLSYTYSTNPILDLHPFLNGFPREHPSPFVSFATLHLGQLPSAPLRTVPPPSLRHR